MGKYTYGQKPLSDQTTLTWQLQDIANELAEANRLKRFELSRLYPRTTWESFCSEEGHGSQEVSHYDKEELEDKA